MILRSFSAKRSSMALRNASATAAGSYSRSWSSGASGAARRASCKGADPRVVWLCGMGFGSSLSRVALTAQTKRHSGRTKRHRGDPKRHKDLWVLLASIVEHLEGKTWPAPNFFSRNA